MIHRWLTTTPDETITSVIVEAGYFGVEGSK